MSKNTGVGKIHKSASQQLLGSTYLSSPFHKESLSPVQMTNSSYKLLLINVISVNNMIAGQNKTWLLSGMCELCRPVSVLCLR